MKALLRHACVVAASCVCALLAGAAGAQGGTIRIGVLYDLTGPLAPAGAEAGYLGTRIAIEMVNERGGVAGLRVVPVVADTQSRTIVALAEAERLLKSEQVELIVGGFANAQCAPLAARMEAAKKVLWTTLCADTAILKDRHYGYVFRGLAHYEQYGAASCEFLAAVAQSRLGIAPRYLKIAIIHENGPYGSGIAAANAQACQRRGMRVVLQQSYEATTPDLADLIVALRQTRPDVVLHTGYNPDVALFLQNALEQNFKFKLLIGHGGGYAELNKLAAVYGADLNYIFDVAPAAAQWLAPTALGPGQQALLDELLRRYQAVKGPGEVPPQASLAFSQTWVLLTDVLPRAVRKYGGAGAEAIRRAALDTDLGPADTPLGQGVRFAPPTGAMAGQNERAAPVVLQFVNKRSRIVWPPALATVDPVMPFPPGHVFAP